MDNVVRKKASLIICILLVMTTLLCSCRVVDRVTNGISRKKEIEAIAQQVMQCIVDENKTDLLKFFSTDIKNNHAQQINLELDRAFEFINGKIISYEYDNLSGERESIDHGRTTYFNCAPGFLNVTTDAGFKYEIWFSHTYTCDKKPERVGISMIEIRTAENYKEYIDVGFIYKDDE